MQEYANGTTTSIFLPIRVAELYTEIIKAPHGGFLSADNDNMAPTTTRLSRVSRVPFDNGEFNSPIARAVSFSKLQPARGRRDPLTRLRVVLVGVTTTAGNGRRGANNGNAISVQRQR